MRRSAATQGHSVLTEYWRPFDIQQEHLPFIDECMQQYKRSIGIAGRGNSMVHPARLDPIPRPLVGGVYMDALISVAPASCRHYLGYIARAGQPARTALSYVTRLEWEAVTPRRESHRSTRISAARWPFSCDIY